MLHMNLEKDELYLNPGVYVGRSDVHRWGVFTETDIKQYDVIQESPYCTFDGDQLKKKKSDVLWRYVYPTDQAGSGYVDEYVIGFGFASLYNHDEEYANCAYELDTVNQVMRHYALEDIPAGSELLLDYGCGEEFEDDDYLR